MPSSASSENISTVCGFAASAGNMRLSATSIPSGAVARQTVAMPPRAMIPWSEYPA